MKKSFYYLLLFISIVVGCSKTTKKKISNFWNVESYEMVSLDSSNTGISEEQLSLIGDSYYHQTKLNHEIDISENGDVLFNFMTIYANGTWTSQKKIYYVKNTLGMNCLTENESGTWNFIKKSKGDKFKKNERILFNTLKRYYEDALVSTNKVPEYTYQPGEKTAIYTILDSTKSKLKLQSKEENTIFYYNFSNDQAYKSKTITISLVAGLPE